MQVLAIALALESRHNDSNNDSNDSIYREIHIETMHERRNGSRVHFNRSIESAASTL
jgi:hypothetical protein